MLEGRSCCCLCPDYCPLQIGRCTLQSLPVKMKKNPFQARVIAMHTSSQYSHIMERVHWKTSRLGRYGVWSPMLYFELASLHLPHAKNILSMSSPPSTYQTHIQVLITSWPVCLRYPPYLPINPDDLQRELWWLAWVLVTRKVGKHEQGVNEDSKHKTVVNLLGQNNINTGNVKIPCWSAQTRQREST